jgi:hypothetical protein
MISGSRVTPQMLGRPVSEANLGDIAGILGMLLEASGISRPFHPPVWQSPDAAADLIADGAGPDRG